MRRFLHANFCQFCDAPVTRLGQCIMPNCQSNVRCADCSIRLDVYGRCPNDACAKYEPASEPVMTPWNELFGVGTSRAFSCPACGVIHAEHDAECPACGRRRSSPPEPKHSGIQRARIPMPKHSILAPKSPDPDAETIDDNWFDVENTS